MKILIASDLYYPTVNGVSTFTRNLAKGLAARGNEVIVVAPSQTGKKYKEVDGDYVIVRTSSVPFPFYQNFRISLNPGREVKKLIKEFQPDVIHIQMLMWIGQAVMRYGNKYHVPIVSTNHAMPENLMDNLKPLAPISRPINYVLRAYGARFHAKADYVTLPTQAAIDMFNVDDKLAVPMTAVSNGIDLARFSATKPSSEIYEKFGLPTDKPIISYIGRLDAEKHLPVLLKAFDEIHTKTDAHLLLVGFGTDQTHLENMAYERGLKPRVTFTGRVEDEDVVELHKVGTVYCMPSPAELQSIATLEAMASGKPIVAVNAGALSELCHDGENGYLCEQDNVAQIAAALLKILSDKGLQRRMKRASIKIAKTHDLQTTLDEFEAIYRELMKK